MTSTKSTPLISVITVCYNAASTIMRTAASVAEQTFDNFEHLIIDGASRDKTLELARQSGRPDMRIISEPDRGLYDAMNKGLHHARGKYVIFLNAGDKFHSPDTLAEYAEAIGPDVDIVYGDTILVDDFGNFVAKRHLSAPAVLDADSFRQGMLVCHQAFMVRKDIAPDYDLQYRFSADYDWCVKCLRASSPQRAVRLGLTINYLTEGLTDKNHFASLKERFAIMVRHYGLVSAIARHLSFVPRLIARKLSN